MVKIEAIIRPGKLSTLKEELAALGVHGLTVFEAGGFGRQRGHKEIFRGEEYLVDLIPKLQINLVTRDELVEQIVAVIKIICYTGEVGDGKIFLYDVKEAIRIRTGERGKEAL